MSGKRRATSELNSDNWDQDEPTEAVGVFTKASEDILKKRVFRTAKRRITKPPEEGSMNAFNPASLANLTSKSSQPANQLFSFLSDIKSDVSKTNGVSSTPNSQADGNKIVSSSLFSFGNSMEPEIKTSSFGNTTENNEGSKVKFSFVGNNLEDVTKASTSPAFSYGFSTNARKFETSGNPLVNSGKKQDIRTGHSENSNVDHYYAKLKGLNESVAKWIAKHVEDNPLINLQPIFKDYERFFDEIEKEYHKSNSDPSNIKSDLQKEETKGLYLTSNHPEKGTASQVNVLKFSASPIGNTVSPSKVELQSMPITKFGAPISTTNKISSEKEELASLSSTFKFGATNTSNNVTTSTSKPLFKFEASTTGDVAISKEPAKFSFGGSNTGFTGFSFTSNPITSSSTTGTINFGSIPSNTHSSNVGSKDDEESEEPPKVEVKEVEEEGQIYTIRCKLFIRKDGTFVEKGVGNLFLKPVPQSDKIQVIVRGHNSLANVLCNFILSKSIPTQRMGKNNVMIVCIPTPESKPPPIPVLIKVKTGEDADQLLETLEKYKK